MNKKPRYFFGVCSPDGVEVQHHMPDGVLISKAEDSWTFSPLHIGGKIGTFRKKKGCLWGVFDSDKTSHVLAFIEKALPCEFEKPTRTEERNKVIKYTCNFKHIF